ncbi:glycerophosphodiester phosphodiesterase [bacterium DOLZORAL124_64_63]|nr:MAG: glycerophosphodiester phosphodiesterase [bacterium DOLZORAL124_64_63]
MAPRPWLCAHRGASGIAPENTLAAVSRAWELGAGMVEVDLQLTRDGHWVLFHDTCLERTSSGQGPLHARSLAELRALDAGSWFGPDFQDERIPTLGELLLVARGRLRLNLELKLHGHEDDPADRVVRALEGAALTDRCILTSFDHDLIAELGGRLSARWRLGLIVGAEDWKPELLDRPEAVLSIHHQLATAERLARIRAAGKAAHVWTVDDPARWGALRAAGAEVIITNHPEFEADETPSAE